MSDKDYEKIKVMAESDAKFDGYDSLHSLSRVSRERYIARAERSYYALQQFNHEKLKHKLEKNEEYGCLTHKSN